MGKAKSSIIFIALIIIALCLALFFKSIISALFILAFISIINWFSNIYIKKALYKSLESEHNLRKERDELKAEIKKNIKEIKNKQLEKLFSLYRFIQFGRLASGLFHDLINPLTTISLNLDRISEKNNRNISKYVKKAKKEIKRMGLFIVSIQKQIKAQKTQIKFNLKHEVLEVIDVLDYKAKENNVIVNINSTQEIICLGDPIKFTQLATNLLSNAIDSYEKVKREKQRIVNINIKNRKEKITIEVQDFGCGIKEEIKYKIFKPFFTTKDTEHGTGIGLTISKEIIEEEFGGTISFKSQKGKGSKFILIFSQNYSR